MERANQLSERAQTIIDSVGTGPNEDFQLASKGWQSLTFKGAIGPKRFSEVTLNFDHNQDVREFTAKNPEGREGETFTGKKTAAKAQGMRAALSAGFTAMGGGLGSVYNYFLGEAIMVAPRNRVAGQMIEMVGRPFKFVGEMLHFIGSELSTTSKKDSHFTVSHPDGAYERVTLRADKTVEYHLSPKSQS